MPAKPDSPEPTTPDTPAPTQPTPPDPVEVPPVQGAATGDGTPPPSPQDPQGPAAGEPVPGGGTPAQSTFDKIIKSPDIPYPESTPQDRQWAIGFHLAGLVGFVLPFGNILAPLILWLIKKQENGFYDVLGKEVLNFQISFTIYGLVTAIIAAALACLVFPIILPLLVLVLWIVYMVMAAIKTSNGEDYRYPMTIRMVK